MPINIERINLHVGYIKDEIELRTESLKVKLDDMNLNYQNELDKFKEELIEYNLYSIFCELLNFKILFVF